MDLAVSRRLIDRRPESLAVVLLTAVVGVGVNVAAGLIAGAVAELARAPWMGRAASAKGASLPR